MILWAALPFYAHCTRAAAGHAFADACIRMVGEVHTLVRNGANHDIYQSPITGKLFSVGRHAKEEVRTGTLKGILKDAGIKIK